MSRPPDSRHLDLGEVFRRVQAEMLAGLDAGKLFEHGPSAGAATERHWIELFDAYLPKRFRAASAFVMNAEGRRSRQIDIAIYDHLATPPLFPHPSGIHLPVECVYAVFEVKPYITRPWIHDAGDKAASVRILTRSRRKILAGILATHSIWEREVAENVPGVISGLSASQRLDFGCALQHGAFEQTSRGLIYSRPEEALIFFVLRLLHRLQRLSRTPEINLLDYLRRSR